jgi:heat shock protein HtpX
MGMLTRLVVIPLAACTRVFVSPLREFEADESSAWLTGDPLALAEALRKLEGYHQASPLPVGSLAMAHLYTVNPSVLIRWAYGCKTHPSTVDRMLYLEAIAQMRDAAAWSDDMNF